MALPWQAVGVALFVGSGAVLVALNGPQQRTRLPELGVHRMSAGTRLGGLRSAFALLASRGVIVAKSIDGRFSADLDVSLVVNGVARPLTIGRQDMRGGDKDAFQAGVQVSLGGEPSNAIVELHVDPATDALIVELRFEAREELPAAHALALRVETGMRGRAAFVSGTGELADLGTTTGAAAVLDLDAYTLGFSSARGRRPLSLSAAAEDGTPVPGQPLRFQVTTGEESYDGKREITLSLRVMLGASNGKIWRPLFETNDVATKKVRGVVTGTSERARVFGVDGDGLPRVRLTTDASGRFEVDVPPTVTQWYAALDPTRTSAPTAYTPGTPWDLKLDVSPGGELTASVTDGDTGLPITARLYVHGIDGTLDPSFGPDYRASGAGPIVDPRLGELITPLPAGKYRVSATKGIEWSIDAKTVEIVGGHGASAPLVLRHVVPTPGVLGCDFHVHARPSFDTPVSPEDRVLSLVSAGIDFAVPSEHNLVGDYGPALEAQDLGTQLATVSGVEVTTYSPRFGHFGLFPYPPGPVPPYRMTNINALFAAARRGDPNRIFVVNHPRLEKGIGYFDIFQWQAGTPLPPPRMRTDFDAVEVYNGYEAARMTKVDGVMHDFYALLNLGRRYVATGSSDSHRIQYVWAGYPRTLVSVGEAAAGEGGNRVDTAAVVAATKKGHSIVTSGPVIELDVQGSHPGDEITVTGEAVTARVVVRAAPWVDVTSLELVVGGREVSRVPIASRPTLTGPELGTFEEASARTVRYEGELVIPVGTDNTWMMVIARGTRAMDDVLPFMPIIPLGFTNPLWLSRAGRPGPVAPASAPRYVPATRPAH